MAEETHHPEDQTASVTTETNTQKIGASVKNMREMREKIETEKNPTTQKELMHQHMQMMKDGMSMMAMTGGQGMGMEPKDTSSMPMADRMAMMEKKMAMMEKATGQGSGMMGGQGMMMANASANPMNDRHDD